jgi:hypothetical protein
MTQSRKTQVALEVTPFYHCYVRCVRRAYLCGEDYSTGQNFDHRKQWIVSRLKFLSYIYAIDICAYAVLSNHYHVVLHADKTRAAAWTHEEVVERWTQLYKGDVLVDKWLAEPASIDQTTWEVVEEIIESWRERLFDISWFMRGVNETIARMANEEEKCKGRFWEGRFKSQALLDETALLSCMAYVDLNPVRATMANDLTESDFTSIQQRLFEHVKDKSVKNDTETALMSRVADQKQLQKYLELDDLPAAELMRFDGSSHTNIHAALPFTQADYFALVDSTGRMIREDKRGFIPSEIPPIIQRLGINPDEWIKHVKYFGRHYGPAAGAVKRLKEFAEYFSSENIKKHWCKGVANSKSIYGVQAG